MSVALAEVNQALRRNIKSGLQYEKYFPKAQCKASQLGKGDTTYTLQLMKQQVVQYQDQTKRIAQILKRSTIPETVKSLYNFAFNHFQYNADGYEQQLRSPACSWASRKLGIDCKSYSLFIGSCLLNMNIPFKFRKITQPNSPDVWSHVYVVIDYKDKELVIDATKKVNTEPTKVKQFDMSVNLPHIGLNGVAVATQLPTGRDLEMIEAINSFNSEFIPFLQSQGIRPSLITEIKAAITNSLSQGIDPVVELLNDSITINNVKYLYGKVVQGMQGLGFAAAASLVSGLDFNKVLGVFSNLFGKDPIAHATRRIIEPMGSYMQEKLQNANPSNVHNVVTELDEHLNAYITHESFVNSKYSKVAIPELKKFLDLLRKQFSDLKSTTQTGVNGTSFRGFWTGDANETLVHADKKPYKYRVYSPSTSSNLSTNVNFESSIQPSNNNFLQRLITTANGFLKDPQTGATYTPEEATQIAKTQQSAQGGSNSVTTGMSTTAKVGIGVGVAALLTIGIYVAKQKNLI
jgi:hypothetical protein